VKIALYGKRFDNEFIPGVEKLIDALVRRGIGITVHTGFHQFLSTRVTLPSNSEVYNDYTDLKGAQFLMSIGGDGTLLETARILRDSRIPVMGVNTGRLGFLSNIELSQVEEAIEAIVNRDFELDRRSLIEVKSETFSFGDFPYALNEVTLLNVQRNSMITVHCYVNDQFMSTYWADGLIIATPTGSTAYSLSCGGPIVMPESNGIILTPVAPHNLNVRPFVISNSAKVSLSAEARDPDFLITLDSRSFTVPCGTIVELTRASFELNLVAFKEQSFFKTIRNKMGWGLDARSKK